MPRLTFHHRIGDALDDVVGMIDLVSRAVSQVTEALLTDDVRLAETVISQDDAIDAIYRRLELGIHEMVATQAPVAGDLRALMATIRMIGDLERSGDLALNIAKTVRRAYPLHLPAEVAQIVSSMGEQAMLLLTGAAEAVRDLEPDAAERLDLMDDVMDSLCGDMFRHFAQQGAGSDDVSMAMHLAMITRYYERIADHAVSVAERVEWLVTGTAHEAHVGL